MYDYLIVGAGFYGAVCAHELNKKGYKVLVIEKREHIGGNAYTEEKDGINIHKYGAHIFHTNDKSIWEYVGKFADFNRFTNSPLAKFDGRLYNLPFNMNTFYQLWGVEHPAEARAIIASQREELEGKEPENLEEKAISLVGRDIYEKFIKGYTEKQWGRKAVDLPAFIINRIPVRFTFDNNYFSDRFQGIPIGGYTQLISNMLSGINVNLGVDFLDDKEKYLGMAKRVIYTGPVDAYFDFKYGQLDYRSLKFETQRVEQDNYQGNAVVNYTESDVPYTRVIEHKHFDYVDSPVTYITKEFPAEWALGDEPYYPVNDDKNMSLYKRYAALAKKENVIFGGRLAEYKYYDMHQVISSALYCVKNILEEK